MAATWQDPQEVIRVRDAMLGGKHAFDADRRLAEKAEEISPGSGALVTWTWAFHARAAELAVTEDRATGVVFIRGGFPPPAGPPHLAAERLAPEARFLYVTNDAVAAAFWRKALIGDARAGVAMVNSVRDPDEVLGEAVPEAGLGGRLCVQCPLDAHYWAPGDAGKIIASYARLLEPGSSLVLSLRLFAATPQGRELMQLGASAGMPVYRHTKKDVRRWLKEAGLEIRGDGIQDVREFGRQWEEKLPRSPAGPIVGVVAVKPLKPASA